MLEDDFSDVIRKAMVGHGIAEDALIPKLGISQTAWQAFMAGEFDAALAQMVARQLGLNPAALVGHPDYHPKPIELAGVQRLELPFGPWGVNAWWVEQGGFRIVFDTGTGPRDLIDALPALTAVAFITLGHHDHVGGLYALQAKGVTIHTPESLKPGEVLICGPLRLRACDLSGHFVPALGYHIEGLSRPVLVVGDALFAGTMGKTPNPERFQLALKTLTTAIAGLPDYAVLLPGHGPATTVEEEKVGNPFLGKS